MTTTVAPPATPFLERLAAAVRRNDSLLCIGLDPEVERLPAHLRALPPAEAILAFNREIIAATADLVACYKPNLAFYEALGPAGLEALRQTLALVPPEIMTLGDAKRGDIGHTTRLYAQALFDVYGFDAVTANPYVGRDGLAPLLDRPERGVFILCRTSNPGAAEITDLPVQGRPLFLVIAERVRAWNHQRNTGLVVGATYPRELAQVRELCPELPILLPGIGAQQGSLEEAVQAGLDGERAGLLVVAARQVLYASSAEDFGAAARRVAQDLRQRINRLR
jgi:orotidine-5'-phosphate decarboxylase